jgi:hypothetical protein
LIYQTPEQYEAETGVKSEETRKYLFGSLDDIGHMNLSTDHLEGGKLLTRLAEAKVY